MTAQSPPKKNQAWSLIGDLAIILVINVQMSLAACFVAKAVAAPAIAGTVQMEH